MAAKYTPFSGLNLPAIENEILARWQQEQAFEKSISLRQGATPFVFYEGPPSANGMPGIHHVISRTLKDLVCRYKTMQGYQVKRKGGWDTHGLPVELQVEKELGITKEDIGKKITVEEYNQKCRETVLRYKDKWDELTMKMGYWVDLKHPYITFENNYIESLWWILKQLYGKDLLYESVSIQPYSPAAGTGLSSHELNQPGCYKDVKDTSVVAMFRALLNPPNGGTSVHPAILKMRQALEVAAGSKASPVGGGLEGAAIYFMAWTTTPWTLPSNLGLTAGPNIEYVLVKTFNPYTALPCSVIMAKALLHRYFPEHINEWEEGYNESLYEAIHQWLDNGNTDTTIEGNPELKSAFETLVSKKKYLPYKVVASFTGKELEGVQYEQLFQFEANQTNNPNAFRVMLGDFVTTEDGTGMVHTAPAFGADDYKVGKKYDIGMLTMVDRQGKFVDGLGEFSNRYVKNYKDDPEYADVNIDISVELKKRSQAFKVEKYEHSYPHCWRTDKPILYYPLDAWFIRTTALKDRMVALNKTINWKPASTGTGRFGNWLENMVDWNLSRSRFWGTPLPVWRTEDGEEEKCIGSIAELINAVNASIFNSKIIPKEYTDKQVTQFNILAGVYAIKKALQQLCDVPEAMHRFDLEEVNSITFIYGQPGDTGKNFKGGYGLSNIIAKREAENGTGYETLIKLVEVIAKGILYKKVEAKQTVHIQYDGYEAILSKDLFGNKETWLLTGWEITEKNKPGADGEFSTTTSPTHIGPTFSRANMGADLSDANISKIIPGYHLDLHKPYVDNVVLVSPTGKPMHRVPDLIDVWFDSGAMPYAQWHFPFENKEIFAQNYPADFIAEGVDQTRGWFYTLHAIGSLIKESIEEEAPSISPNGGGTNEEASKDSQKETNATTKSHGSAPPPLGEVGWGPHGSQVSPAGGDLEGAGAGRTGLAYKTVVSNGLVLDRDGNKMSKRLGNVVDPFYAIGKYGADATRWYLITNASPWDNLKFSWEKPEGKPEFSPGIEEVQRKFFGTLYNTYQFFVLYANVDGFAFKEAYIPVAERPEIDRWILSSLHTLIQDVTRYMDDYEPTAAGRAIETFVDEHLSNWYVRLSRRRFWKGEYEQDKICAYQTLYECLETVMRLIAPIAPFFSDAIYTNLNTVSGKNTIASIHHAGFPKTEEKVIDKALEERMQLAQDISSLLLSIRKKVNIKVRQPLQKVLIPVLNPAMKAQLQKVEDLVKAEVNVKEMDYLTDTEGFIKKKIKPNFIALGKKLGPKMKAMSAALAAFTQQDIATLERDGQVEISLSGEPFTLKTDEVDIAAEDIPGWSVASKGSLTVALDLTLTPELQQEGDARELVNRIQNIRKDRGFALTDRIDVKLSKNDVLENSVTRFKGYICAEILADSLAWVAEITDGTQIEVNENQIIVSLTKKDS